MADFVIVGASLAGAKAAETLREQGFTGRVVLIGEESERPYERPPLSKGYLLGKDAREKAYVHEESWYADHDVELMLGVRATGVDALVHQVLLAGRDAVRYDKLLLATGSRVRRLDVPGADLDGVRYLRTILRFGATVASFGGTGSLSEVVLNDGTVLPADHAIVGVGIQPNTELAVSAGLEVDNGIVTDAGLRTSDPDIYAAGDAASSDNPLLGRRVRVEHWANALNGGKAAGRAMLGEDVVYDRVPYFFSDQYDLGMEYSGYVEPGGYDRVVFRGDVERREFIAFWVSGGRVLAGMNVNVWDVTDDIQKLVRAGYGGRSVDLERLDDQKVPLAELLD